MNTGIAVLDQLAAGELPEIKVQIQKETIVNFALALLIVFTISILVYSIFKRTV